MFQFRILHVQSFRLSCFRSTWHLSNPANIDAVIYVTELKSRTQNQFSKRSIKITLTVAFAVTEASSWSLHTEIYDIDS
jgi:hypothetical protein